MKTITFPMKSVYSLLLILSLGLVLVNCESGVLPENMFLKEGTFSLTLTPDEVKSEVVTRASLNPDVATFQVTLTESEGAPLFEKRLFGELTETECILPAATGYHLKAESCTPDEAITLNEGWGMAHFVATTTFDIVSDQHTPVSLTCTMDNVGLQVVFDQNFLDKFPIHAATTQDSRTIVFNQTTEEQTAYFPVEGDALNMKLRLTGSAGGWEDRLDVVKELTLLKGKIYIVNIAYNNSPSEVFAMRLSELK